VEPDDEHVPGKPTRVAEAVAGRLRQSILSGELPQGTLPTQDALMSRFGVSAPSLREALRILEVEGLVTVRRGRLGGAEVHRPNGASVASAIGLTLQGEGTHVQELAAAVLLLEPVCAGAFAGDRARREALGPAVEDNLRRSAEALGDGLEFTRLGREFHDLLVDGNPNSAIRLVARSVCAVWSTQEVTWAAETIRVGHYPEISGQQSVLRAHRRIAKAIFAGDPAAAEDVTRRHVEATHRLVLAELGNHPVDASSPVAITTLRRLAGPFAPVVPAVED
jgi:DNA-binding FadR family transcriptional regulator